MKKTFLTGISFLISVLVLSSFTIARGATTNDQQQRQAALNAVSAVSTVFKGLQLKAFRQNSGYWEAKTKLGGQSITFVLFKQKNKNSYDVAFTAPFIKLGNLIAVANKGEFAKFGLKHATMIIVSPNSWLDAKQGTDFVGKVPKPIRTKVSMLPKPIAQAIGQAHPNLREISLPTGIFLINQFLPGGNKFVGEVFKQSGLGNPVVSFAQLDASNYADILKGKAMLKMSFLLRRDNPVNRALELTQVLKSPRDAEPILTLSAATSGESFKLAYKAPYLVAGLKKAIQTELYFNYKKGKVSGALAVDLGDLKNPTIVPVLVELKDVSMDDVRLSVSYEPGPKATAMTVGFRTPKMVVKNRRRYEPVQLQLAMTPAGPTGALIDLKSEKVDLGAIADLAEVAFRAHPASQAVPNWAKKDIANKLQLDKLPPINIHQAQIYLATPGQSKSSHLADFHGIGGAGALVKGKLYAFKRSLAMVDLGLDTKRGLKARAGIEPFAVGPLALKDASFDIKAGPDGAPHFKILGKGTIKGVTLAETVLNLSRSGFKWTQDFGCLPPMVKASIATKGFTPSDISVNASNCAAEVAKAALNAGKVAAVQVAETSGKAVKAGEKASKEAGKWVAGAAGAAKKFAKDTGCKVSSFFGGKCNKRKRERERKAKREAALAKAADYRKKVPTPGHCGWGWYWNHKYRTCWRSPDAKMLVHTLDGAAQGLCVNAWGKKVVAGSVLALWDCLANSRQQFTQEPVGEGPYFLLKGAHGTCFRAKSGKAGAKVVLAKCKNQASQRWRLAHGRLIGRNNLCLRSEKRNNKKSHLLLQKCDVGITVSKTAKPPIEWAFVTPAANAAKHYHKKFGIRTLGKLRIGKWCLESPALLPHENIRLRKCNSDKSSQLFSIGNVWGNYFALVARNSKMCLDLFAYKKHDGANVVTWPCNYGGNQQWVAVIGDDKTTTAKTFKHKTGFMIKSQFTGKCLAPLIFVRGQVKIAATNGAHFVQVKCNPRDPNMRFKMASR